MNRVAKNAAWIIACKIVQSLITLVIGMLTARYLGPSNYGLITYASSLVAFALPIMQLGMANILVRELVDHPTREDNFPTVNMEALACGTPVITFNTGGSPEALDESCGSVVDCDDTDALEREIIRVCREWPYSREACCARAGTFDPRSRLRQYIALYHEAASAQCRAEKGSI